MHSYVLKTITYIKSNKPENNRDNEVRTRNSATEKSTARPSCLVGVLYDISQEKIC